MVKADVHLLMGQHELQRGKGNTLQPVRIDKNASAICGQAGNILHRNISHIPQRQGKLRVPTDGGMARLLQLAAELSNPLFRHVRSRRSAS